MSETAAYMALVATASAEGVEARRQHLIDHGPHEMGWSYANILDVDAALQRQLRKKGFFRVYLFVANGEGAVRYTMKVTGLRTTRKAEVFSDPVDGHWYMVHSRMTVESITRRNRPAALSEFSSVDRRKPDIRHLQLGFLFVVDPEV